MTTPQRLDPSDLIDTAGIAEMLTQETEREN